MVQISDDIKEIDDKITYIRERTGTLEDSMECDIAEIRYDHRETRNDLFDFSEEVIEELESMRELVSSQNGSIQGLKTAIVILSIMVFILAIAK